MSTEVAGPRYPADVQAALDHVREEGGWTIEAYQAVLSIALGHLDGFEQEPESLEVHIMWAEEAITYLKPAWDAHQVGYVATTEGRVVGIYVVCPHCLSPSQPEMHEKGVMSRHTYWEDIGDAGEFGEPTLSVGDNDDAWYDAWYYVCPNPWCYGRVHPPRWLDPDYV